jgi:hypothetical protein
MAKATPQARLAAGRRKAARREHRGHQREAKQPCFLRDSRSDRHEADARDDAFVQHWGSIQLAHGSMRNSHGLRQNDAAPALADPCPILPQLNVIQCTDRRMAAT